MADLVIQEYESRVEVDILELSWLGVGIFHTSIGLGLMMVKEIGLKLTLRMADISPGLEGREIHINSLGNIHLQQLAYLFSFTLVA